MRVLSNEITRTMKGSLFGLKLKTQAVVSGAHLVAIWKLSSPSGEQMINYLYCLQESIQANGKLFLKALNKQTHQLHERKQVYPILVQ